MTGDGRFAVPADVGWTLVEGDDAVRIFVAVLPVGPIFVLEGSSAVIWQLAPHGPAEELPVRVAEAMSVSVAEVHDEVVACARDLVSRGLLSDTGGSRP